MTIRFTSPGNMVEIAMPAAFQTLANNAVSLSTDAESNNDSAELLFFRNFALDLGAQTARTGTPTVSLVIVPYHGTLLGDVRDEDMANAYIATDKDGNKVTWKLDAAVTACTLTWANVCLPASDYYVGVLNESTQAFANTNALWASSAFSVQNTV